MTAPAPSARPGAPAVLVGRPEHQAQRLVELLEAAGCRPVCAPLVAIAPPGDDGAGLDAAVTAFVAGGHDVLAVTSGNAVEAFAAALAPHAAAGRAALRACTVACVGPSTAATLRACLDRAPDVVAPVHTGAGLAAALRDWAGEGSRSPRAGSEHPVRALLPRSDRASPVLPDALVAAGWTVDDVTAYRTVPVRSLPDDVAAELHDGTIEVVTLTSPSAVAGLVTSVGADITARVVAIGPVTAAAARAAGLRVAAVADPHTVEGLVAAVDDVT